MLNLTEVNLKIIGQWPLQDLDRRYGEGDRGAHASLGRSWLWPPFINKLGIRHLLESNLTTGSN